MFLFDMVVFLCVSFGFAEFVNMIFVTDIQLWKLLTLLYCICICTEDAG